MADNRHYWVDRDKRAKIANQWTARMEKKHSHLINTMTTMEKIDIMIQLQNIQCM